MNVSDLIVDLKLFEPSMRIFIEDPDIKGFTTPGVHTQPLFIITKNLARSPIVTVSNIEFAAVVGLSVVESVGEFIADLKKIDPDIKIYIFCKDTDLYTTPILISCRTLQIVTPWYALDLNERTHTALKSEKVVILS